MLSTNTKTITFEVFTNRLQMIGHQRMMKLAKSYQVR